MDKQNDFVTIQDDGEELSLLDILIILAEQKKLIAAVALLCVLAGFVYAMLSPQSYTEARYR